MVSSTQNRMNSAFDAEKHEKQAFSLKEI